MYILEESHMTSCSPWEISLDRAYAIEIVNNLEPDFLDNESVPKPIAWKQSTTRKILGKPPAA